MGRSTKDKKEKSEKNRNNGPAGQESEIDSDVDLVSDFQESDDDRCSTPASQKDTKCSVCARIVNSSDKSLQCDKCNEWCHIKCGGVTKEHYRQMVELDESNIEIQWHCPPCDKLNNPKGQDLDKIKISESIEQQQQSNLGSVSKSVAAAKPNTIPITPLARPMAPGATAIPLSAIPLPTTKMVMTQNGRPNAGRLSFPDCKIRDLPFFPVKATLLRPCNLTPKDTTQEAQQQNLAFYLTQEQANTVNNGRKVEANGMVVYKMHILLRFTKKGSDNIHDDDFPKNLCLKVNNKICPLPNPKPVPANRPNMEAKRPPKPLIITSLCKLNTKSCLNQISITWTPTDCMYTVSIYLVEKLSPSDLLGCLKGRGQRDPEITRTLISSKLEDKEEDEIATTSCKVTMSCPLGMARMTYPARASTCDHLQCFDADTYLRMNEKKPKWVCPVCNKPAYFDDLFLDGFYIQLLQSAQFRALSTNDIVLNQDASWVPVISEGVGVSDDSEDDGVLPTPLKPVVSTSVDPDVIPITPDVDADGAPILLQLAQLPIAPKASAGVNGTVRCTDDDDFFKDGRLAHEDDFVDWNFSVKFYNFIREAPESAQPSQATAPSPAVKAIADEPTAKVSCADSPAVVVSARPNEIKPKPVAAATRGGRGSRGRPRGAAARVEKVYAKADSEDLDYSSDEKKKPKSRGRGGGRGSRGRGAGSAKRAKYSRYIESSGEEEESSESEEEVLSRPVAATNKRPSRNCRRSTNYADIEKAGDVLDYLLN